MARSMNHDSHGRKTILSEESGQPKQGLEED